MAKWLKFYVTYTFSTSPHSCDSNTLLNTNVQNFTIPVERQNPTLGFSEYV